MSSLIIDNRFRLDEIIGEGGMAKVYRAFDLQDNRTVALKVLDLSGEIELCKRFVREFNVTSRLNHPNIIELYDYGSLPNGQPYFTMEYLPFPTLGAVMDDLGSIGQLQCLFLLKQLTSALGRAHEAGIIHRDLKPGNIIVSNEGRLILIDFGLAKDSQATKFTETGAILGTPQYMAPELITGGKATVAVDIYAIGLITYEMLAGCPAFSANNLALLARAILNEQPKPIGERVKDLHHSWDEAIAKCLHKDPSLRYESIDEVKKALSYISSELQKEQIVPTEEETNKLTRSKAKLIDNRYEIVDELGHGGMAAVYLAEDKVLHRNVALKVIGSKLKDSPELVKRFEREFRICADCEHENIIRLFDNGTLPNGAPFYTMEYLGGESLEDMLDEGPLGSEKVEKIFLAILRGTGFLHEKGIIHRDLKPANIMITATDRPVLLDFGLAISDEHTRLTNTGSIIGTLYFLAPEVLAGKRATAKSDVYSLGIILYYMLTGKLPFQKDKPEEFFLSVLAGVYVPLTECAPDKAARWEHIIKGCLTREPADRYANASEVEKAILGKPRVEVKSVVEMSTDDKKSDRKWLYLAFPLLLLAYFLWPSSYDVLALSYRSIPCGVKVMWQSSTPYPTQLRCFLKNDTFFEKKCSDSTKKHEVTITPLAPGEKYDLAIVFPKDTVGEPFVASAGHPSVSITDVRATDASCRIELSGLPSSAHGLEINCGENVVSKSVGKPFPLNEQVGSILITGQTICGCGYKIDIAPIIRKELNELIPVLREFEPQDLAQRRGKKGSMQKALDETLLVEKYERAMILAPLVLSTRILDLKERLRFYETVHPFIRYGLLSLIRGQTINLPQPYLGPFALTTTRNVRAKEVVTILPGGEKIRIGNHRLLQSRTKAQHSWAKTFVLSGLKNVLFAQLRIQCSGTDDHSAILSLNSLLRTTIYGRPKLAVKKEDRYETIYQNIPVDCLKNGENVIVFSVDDLYRGIQDQRIDLRGVELIFATR